MRQRKVVIELTPNEADALWGLIVMGFTDIEDEQDREGTSYRNGREFRAANRAIEKYRQALAQHA